MAHERVFTTQPAAPDPADPTRTSEPTYKTVHAARPGPATAAQRRNPDRYRILAEHGRGGIGRISRAHDLELGRDIAIKELISRGPVNEVRFLREALITARLEHPGIVPVHEAGRWPDGTPFYAMKLVAGRPLRDLITARNTVEERIALLHHVIAVADAIAYAHDRNIIHRDLKPSNVIVGDFGETVVIDWGLAKEVTDRDDSLSSAEVPRALDNDDLTSTGSILGTPAYMSPEQSRGESVDQRTDVFAIGVMLWELCTLRKLPTSYSRQRRGILRQSGIDPDLITIIEKALAADPRHRYPDAGALASDLKAFKAGARIAARNYSLFAVLVHWARHHRALSLVTMVVIVSMASGVSIYVHDISSERERADKSEVKARHSQTAAEASLDELTLEHANLLLTTDPTAAFDLLASYRGEHRGRAAQIRAEAVGQGIAVLRAKPHMARIQWVAGLPDRSLLSLSVDGTITRTLFDQRSIVMATGVSLKGRFAYAPSRGLLAYGCDPADVCMWDAVHGTLITSAEFRDWQLAGIAFSPEGSKIVLLSYSGLIRIFDVSNPTHPVARLEIRRDHAVGVLFADEESIVIGLSNPLGLEIIGMNGTVQTLKTDEHFLWEAIPSSRRLVLATHQGDGIYLARDPLRVLNRASLCHGKFAGLKLLPDQRTVAFACDEGLVGTWELQSQSPTHLARLDGHADRIAVDQSGEYLLAAGGNGTLAVVDLLTKMVAIYRGHGFSLTAISPPTSNFPYIVSADVRGSIRAWPLPSRIVRVSANIHTRFASVVFSKLTHEVWATTFGPQVVALSPPAEPRFVEPHVSNATNLEIAANGRTFVAYGSSESVEIWSTDGPTRRQIVATGHGTVSHVAFLGETEEFATAGRDGRLLYWTSAGRLKRAIQFPRAIDDFLIAIDGKFALVNTSDGAIWRADDQGSLTNVHSASTKIIRMLHLPGTASVVLAYANGQVTVLDTILGHEAHLLQVAQSVRDLAVAPDGRTLALADNDDVVHVGQLRSSKGVGADVLWKSFPMRASGIALTADGLLIAIASDGAIWLYSSITENWMYLPTGTADLTNLAVSTDEKTAAAFDTDGRSIWVDLEEVRKLLLNN